MAAEEDDKNRDNTESRHQVRRGGAIKDKTYHGIYSGRNERITEVGRRC